MINIGAYIAIAIVVMGYLYGKIINNLIKPIIIIITHNIRYPFFILPAICQYNHTPFGKLAIVLCKSAVSSKKNTLNLESFSESSTFKILCP